MSLTLRHKPTRTQNSLPYMKKPQKVLYDNIVSFDGNFGNYCVCIVDAVNSTKITAGLSTEKACKYYSIFLNTMASIAEKQDARIVKNIGDSLLYCFPKKSGYQEIAHAKPLECGISMIEYSDILNKKMKDEGLPPVRYRISSDYGTVMLAKSTTSSCDDMFGSTVNICSKINHLARPNEMVIGNDLYQIVKSCAEFRFEPIQSYSIGLKYEYPVFSITRNH